MEALLDGGPVQTASAPPPVALTSPTAVEPTTDAVDVATASQFVTFDVAGEMFAVPMAPVQEIIRVPEVARLPLAPAALDGLSNLRGRVLPIVNLRRIFGVPERINDESTRALVVHVGQALGFVVDRVASVIHIEPGELQPAQALQGIVKAEHVCGVIQRSEASGDRRLLMVLDFPRLVAEHFGALSSAAQSRDALSNSAGADALSGDGARARVEEAGASEERRLVSFTVAAQEYALDIAHVQEIVQVPERITALPRSAVHVLGLISLRQRLLPLVSLRSLFALPPQPVDEHHRIVVVTLPGGVQVGLVTDSVKEVLGVPRQQTEPVPSALSRNGEMQEFEAICRLDEGRRLVSILDTSRLLGLQGIRDALDAARQAADGTAAQSTEDPDMARSTATRVADSDDVQVVIFRLGAEEFGVPIMNVQEIVRVPEVLTRVPRTPDFVEGVINLRGTVLPVMDQRKRLGLPSIERNDRQRIMVYTLAGVRTGFIVDSVAEVLRIGRAQIAPAPELGDGGGRLIAEVARLDDGKRLVMLIAPDQLLGAGETSIVRSWGGEAAAGEHTPQAQPALSA